MRTNNSGAVQAAIVQALGVAPMTNRELHVAVSRTMAERGMSITPQSVRSRTKELEDAGLVRRVGLIQSHKTARRVTIWGLV